MDIVKKSKEYAEGKALEAISSAIAQAYADGYKDGLQHLENERLESLKSGVTYVDLGLTSGTLWSSQCLTKGKGIEKLPYLEAAKLNIPTVDQYEELCKECKVVPVPLSYDIENLIGFKFTGKTGKSILISFYTNLNLNARESYYFWLKDDAEGSDKDCACLWGRYEKLGLPFKHKHFMGLKFPVMLVK